MVAEIDPDRFGLRVLVKRLQGIIPTTESRKFVTTEGGVVMSPLAEAVDADGAGLEIAGGTVRLLEIGAKHRSLQSVAGVIGEIDRLGIATHTHYREYRTEDLLDGQRVLW